MRKTILVVCLFLLLPMFVGCAVSDALFAVFGDHYTGGGYTEAAKEDHYDRQIEASRNYGAGTASAPDRRPWDP